MPKNITIICGPTSTGKSSFALKLAKKSLPSLIISADSRQFFKDIPIISGQDNIDSLPKGISLAGQGFLESDHDFSISQYQRYFYKQVEMFPKHSIFVVGGSGLYLKAISQRIDTTHIPQNKKLRDKLNNYSLENLQDELKKTDFKKFNLLNNSDINNPRRLIRAIEIASYSQRSTVIPALVRNPGTIKFSWVGLKKSKEKLAKDIQKRVKNRIKAGAVNEVKNLLKKYPDRSLPIYTAIGVKQIIQYLNGKIDKTELINIWTQAEISYAKRQVVWFKKQAQIVWYDNDI